MFHLINWSTVITKKEEGGLGIREPHLLNIALGEKVMWNLLTHEEDWWAKIITKKYFQSNISQLIDPEKWKGRGSPIWNLIKILAPLILDHLTTTTGNGKTLKIWDHILMKDIEWRKLEN